MTALAPPIIDARGLRCPMPVLRLRRAMAEDAAMPLCVLLSDDPAALADVPAFVAEMGWRIVERHQDGAACRWHIARSAGE